MLTVLHVCTKHLGGNSRWNSWTSTNRALAQCTHIVHTIKYKRIFMYVPPVQYSVIVYRCSALQVRFNLFIVSCLHHHLIFTRDAAKQDSWKREHFVKNCWTESKVWISGWTLCLAQILLHIRSFRYNVTIIYLVQLVYTNVTVIAATLTWPVSSESQVSVTIHLPNKKKIPSALSSTASMD